MGGLAAIFGHPNAILGYHLDAILTPEGRTSFIQNANLMLEALLQHISETCGALQELSLAVKKSGYTSKKDRSNGLSESPPPVVPAYLSIHLSPRLTSLTLTGFAFPLDNFEMFSFAKLRKVHFVGTGAVAATEAVKVRPDFPPETTIKGIDIRN